MAFVGWALLAYGSPWLPTHEVTIVLVRPRMSEPCAATLPTPKRKLPIAMFRTLALNVSRLVRFNVPSALLPPDCEIETTALGLLILSAPPAPEIIATIDADPLVVGEPTNKAVPDGPVLFVTFNVTPEAINVL